MSDTNAPVTAPATTTAATETAKPVESQVTTDKKPLSLQQAKEKAMGKLATPAAESAKGEPGESKAEIKLPNDVLSRLTLLEAENRRLKRAQKPETKDASTSQPGNQLQDLAALYKKDPKAVIKQLAGVEDANEEMDRLLSDYVRVPGDDGAVDAVKDLKAEVEALKARDKEREESEAKSKKEAEEKVAHEGRVKFVGDILDTHKDKFPRSFRNRDEAIEGAIEAAGEIARVKAYAAEDLTQEVVAEIMDEALAEVEAEFADRAKRYTIEEAKTEPERPKSVLDRDNSTPVRATAQSTPATLPKPGVSTTPTPSKMSLKQAIEKAKERAASLGR